MWGFIGTIVGACVSILTAWLSINSNRLVQETKAKEERQERANTFQRDTLLEMQQSVHDVLRLVHRAYIEDCKSLHEGTPWQKAKLSDELNESVRLALSKVSILVERIADDEVRLEVKTLTSIASQAMHARSESEAREHLEHSQVEGIRVFESLGRALRAKY